jgi:hypothetical protein
MSMSPNAPNSPTDLPKGIKIVVVEFVQPVRFVLDGLFAFTFVFSHATFLSGIWTRSPLLPSRYQPSYSRTGVTTGSRKEGTDQPFA